MNAAKSTTSPSAWAVALAIAIALPLGGCGKADPSAAGGGLATTADVVTPQGTRRRLTIDVAAELQRAKEALAKGAPHEAIKALYPVVAEAPEQLDARVLLATAYSAEGQHAKALQQAEGALRLDATSQGAILAKGLALAGMGRVQEAIQTTREVTRQDAHHAGAWLNLARFHGVLQQWDQQEVALDRLIGLQPDVIGHRVARARALLRLSRLQEARTALEAALERIPHDADAQLLLAAVLYEQGELKAAMDRADIAARLDPDRANAFDLFRAAFYVAVASALQCRHGDPPWPKDKVDGTLETYRRQGIDNVKDFFEIHASYGQDPGVKARIAALAQKCREQPKVPGP